MDEYLKQIRSFLQGLSAGQKLWLAGGAVLVALILFVFVRLIGNADYKTLYSGLAPSEAQSLAQKLAAQSIPYELSGDGTALSVPADQLDRVRLDMASKELPQSGRLGFELFDKPNWSGSDFSEKVNYQRAMEAELERTIQTMDEVEGVRVHLVLPRESIFAERERPAKAAVVVKLRQGRLSEQTVSSITYLVASAWDHLTPDNVTVVSADGRTPVQKHRRIGPGGVPVPSSELETALAERIVATLTPMLGANQVKSSVTIDYDLNSGESTQEIYDPNASVVLSSQISQDQLGDVEPSGVPGTASNTPGSTAPAAKSKEVGIGQRNESKTFAVSKTIRHLVEPAGRVRRIAAAVLVDDVIEAKEENGKKQETRRKRTPEEMKQIEELAKAAMGFEATRGDQLAVQNVSFQVEATEKLLPPTMGQRAVRIAERSIGWLRYAALAALFAVVYLLVLRPVKRRVLVALSEMPARMKAGARPVAALTSNRSEIALAPQMDTMDFEATLQQELTESNSEVQRAVMLKRHLQERIKKEPGSTSQLIQNWIRQSEARK
jgi:flagellar M-ring protein FliF